MRVRWVHEAKAALLIPTHWIHKQWCCCNHFHVARRCGLLSMRAFPWCTVPWLYLGRRRPRCDLLVTRSERAVTVGIVEGLHAWPSKLILGMMRLFQQRAESHAKAAASSEKQLRSCRSELSAIQGSITQLTGEMSAVQGERDLLSEQLECARLVVSKQQANNSALQQQCTAAEEATVATALRADEATTRAADASKRAVDAAAAAQQAREQQRAAEAALDRHPNSAAVGAAEALASAQEEVHFAKSVLSVVRLHASS